MHQRLHNAFLLAVAFLLLLFNTCNAFGGGSSFITKQSNGAIRNSVTASLWSWTAPHVLQEEDASPIHDRQKEEKLFNQWDIAKLVFDTGEAVGSTNAFTAEDILDIKFAQKHFNEAHRQVKALLSQHEQRVIRDTIQKRISLVRSLQEHNKPVPALEDTLEIPVLVDVNVFPMQQANVNQQLERHLQALSREKSFVHVISVDQGETRHDKNKHKRKDKDKHRLPVAVKYAFNVNTVSKEMERKITQIIRKSVHGANQTQRGGVAYVDVDAVDEVIRADHVDSHGKGAMSTSYSIYLFGVDAGVEPIARYLYTSKEEECGFQFWKGQDRYVVIDLSATVLEAGRRLNGRGNVVPEILPQWPRTSGNEDLSSASPAFFPKLVALVSHILSYIVFPSLHQLPFIRTEEESTSGSKTLIQIVHVGAKRDLSNVYSSIVHHIKQLPALALENVVFAPAAKVVSFQTCNLCAIALVDAVRHRSVRRSAGNAPIAYGSYLNSSVLVERMRMFKDRIVKDTLGASQASQRVLPVFVLETDGMLLDDEFLAVGSSDFILGVSIPPNERWETNLQCPQRSMATNGLVTLLESSGKRLGVELLDAIFKSGWGISSYHERWCPIRNEIVQNYLFGVRKTDLLTRTGREVVAIEDGPLLGFSVKDSAVRNLELAQVIAALEDVRKTNTHLEWYRRVRGVDMFYGKQTTLLEMFAECECVQSHALDQTGKLFALHDYEHARHYLNILEKAARASRLLVLHTASRYKPPETDCFA